MTEHQLFNKRCKCEHLNRASFPTGVTTPVSYGENTQSLIADMSARHYLPVMRLAEFLIDVLGLSVSTGGVGYIMKKMRIKATDIYEIIRQNVLKNSVVGADETCVNINRKNNWAWIFQNERVTFIAIHPNRGYKAIENITSEGFQNNIPVTDCWSSYFKTKKAASHQVCIAHLLRELAFLKERYPNETWASRMEQLIINSLNLRRDNSITKLSVTEILIIFSDLIAAPLNPKAKLAIVFQKRMAKYSDYVFNLVWVEFSDALRRKENVFS